MDCSSLGNFASHSYVFFKYSIFALFFKSFCCDPCPSRFTPAKPCHLLPTNLPL